jgi:hypothetical protein
MDPLESRSDEALMEVEVQNPSILHVNLATCLGGSVEGTFERRSPRCPSGDFSDPMLGMSTASLRADLDKETVHAVPAEGHNADSSTLMASIPVLRQCKPAVPTSQRDPASLRWLEKLGWIRWREEQIQLGLPPSTLVSLIKAKDIEGLSPLQARDNKFMRVSNRQIFLRLRNMLEDGDLNASSVR